MQPFPGFMSLHICWRVGHHKQVVRPRTQKGVFFMERKTCFFTTPGISCNIPHIVAHVSTFLWFKNMIPFFLMAGAKKGNNHPTVDHFPTLQGLRLFSHLRQEFGISALLRELQALFQVPLLLLMLGSTSG